MRHLFLYFVLLSALFASAQKWKPVNASFDSIMLECEEALLKVKERPDGFKENVQKLEQLAEESQDERLIWRALFGRAKYESRQADSQALRFINNALEMVDSVKYPYDYQRMLFLKYGRLENSAMVNVYSFANRSLKYFQRINDPLLQAEAYALQTRALANIGIWDKSLESLKSAIEIYSNLGKEEAVAVLETNNIWLYVFLGDSVQAKEKYQKLVNYPPLMNDPGMAIIFYTNVGISGLDVSAIQKAYDLAIETEDRDRIFFTSSNLADYIYKEGQIQRALELYKQALQVLPSNGVNNDAFKLNILKGLSKSYESLGKMDSAFIYLKKYIIARDSLETLNSTANFQEAYERQALEREEERVVYEQSRARNRLLVTVLVFALVLFAAIFAYNRQRLRRKLKEAENKELEAQVKAEQLQKELYQQRSEESERELTTSSLLLIEKKKMIDNLTSRIEQHGTEGHIDHAAKRDLKNLISMHQGTEESLEKFYDYFNQLHPDFFSGLKERYPSLTKGELRLCAYIRMGLDTKQIAQMLSVDPGSIKKARYRIRGKMGMATSESLDDLLMMFPDKQPSREKELSEGDTSKHDE